MPWRLFCFLSLLSPLVVGREEFHEELYIKPFPGGDVLTYFQFTTLWSADIRRKDTCKCRKSVQHTNTVYKVYNKFSLLFILLFSVSTNSTMMFIMPVKSPYMTTVYLQRYCKVSWPVSIRPFLYNLILSKGHPVCRVGPFSTRSPACMKKKLVCWSAN